MGIEKKIRRKKPGIRVAAAAIALMLAASPTLAYAKTADTENVEKMIEVLPTEKEVTENDAERVRSTMESYMGLTFAEQTDISQEMYEKLDKVYQKCLTNGYITDIEKEASAAKEEEERTAREQAALTPSETTEIGVTSYTFAITPDLPSKSVVMRYTIDIDGDKLPDPPSVITVTTPTGEMFSVDESNVEMKTEGHHIIYTWTDKFLQFDIAKAENGNWKIEVSDPCVFSRMDYAGPRLDITPEKEKEDTPVITPENEGGGGGLVFALIGLLVVFGGLVFAAVKFFGVELPSLPAPKSNKRGRITKADEEEEDDDETPYEPTEEEVNQIIRAEVMQRQKEAEEMDLSAEDDMEEDIDGGEGDGFRVYREGETGLLDGENNPFNNGGGLVESEETEPYTDNSKNSVKEEEDDFFDDGIFD